MRRLLALAGQMCWGCSLGKCEFVIKKDNACVCCRRNHR